MATAARCPYGIELPPALDPDGQLKMSYDEVLAAEREARRAEASARRARDTARRARIHYDALLRLQEHYGGLPLEGLTP